MPARTLPCSCLDNGLNLSTSEPVSQPQLNVFTRVALVIVLLQSNGKFNSEVGTRDWGIAVIGLAMLLFKRMWILGLWIWNTVECFKWDLMGHPSRTMEDFVAGSDLNCVDLAQEISKEKYFSMWHRDCLCGILVENVAAFLPLSEEST